MINFCINIKINYIKVKTNLYFYNLNLRTTSGSNYFNIIISIIAGYKLILNNYKFITINS